MTYCVGVHVEDGLVFVSDTRTNAGIDHISTFRKINHYQIEGDRILILQTAGNLATSQSVFAKIQQDITEGAERNLLNTSTMHQAALMVGEYAREVTRHAQSVADKVKGFTSSFILGGQIKNQEPELYQIYTEGNSIHSTPDTHFFQIGEVKYGKPILDRSLTFESTIEAALKAALISFDSTIRSNLSVGFPLDLIVYHKGSLSIKEPLRIDRDDEYISQIRVIWNEGLKKILDEVPHVPEHYSASQSPDKLTPGQSKSSSASAKKIKA